MEHPNLEQRKNQKQFLQDCPEEQREFHAQMFRVGNAAVRYHQEARQVHEPTQEDFEDWLVGLSPNMRNDMRQKGFEQCKTFFPFTRHVMERRDIGMNEWMKNHLSEGDYKFWTGNASAKR